MLRLGGPREQRTEQASWALLAGTQEKAPGIKQGPRPEGHLALSSLLHVSTWPVGTTAGPEQAGTVLSHCPPRQCLVHSSCLVMTDA